MQCQWLGQCLTAVSFFYYSKGAFHTKVSVLQMLDVERYHAATCEEAMMAADNKLHRCVYTPQQDCHVCLPHRHFSEILPV